MKTHYLYLAKIVAFNEEQMPMHFHCMGKNKTDCPQPCRILVFGFQPGAETLLVLMHVGLSMLERCNRLP